MEIHAISISRTRHRSVPFIKEREVLCESGEDGNLGRIPALHHNRSSCVIPLLTVNHVIQSYEEKWLVREEEKKKGGGGGHMCHRSG